MKNEPKVIREISPNDGMFRGNLEHYFAVGERHALDRSGLARG